MFGSNSLNSMPQLPCFLNSNGEPTQSNCFCPLVMPVMRWPIRTDAGNSVFVSSLSLRLVIEQIDVRWRTRLEKVNDALGFRRMMQLFNQRRHSVWRPRFSSPRQTASRSAMKPARARPTPWSCAREMCVATRGCWNLRDKFMARYFVMVSFKFKSTLATPVMAARSAVSKSFGRWRVADGKQRFSGGFVAGEIFMLFAESFLQHFDFLSAWRAAQYEPEGVARPGRARWRRLRAIHARRDARAAST